MNRRYRLNATQIQQTTRAVIAALALQDLECCLIGSTAAAIYGAENRNPNDVDVVVLNALPLSSALIATTEQREERIQEIKDQIIENQTAQSDNTILEGEFYLVPSTDPGATYEILWYNLTPEFLSTTSSSHRACKVDLLSPGTLGIPPITMIPKNKIYHDESKAFNDIPLMPFMILLLLKLKAWSDHRLSMRRIMRLKIPNDESDVKELLDLACNEYLVRVGKTIKWMGDGGEEWMRDVEGDVIRWCEVFPETRSMWVELGFIVPGDDDWGYCPT